MEANLLSRKQFLQGITAKGAEYILNNHPAGRALSRLTEGEPPPQLEIIQTGIDQLEPETDSYTYCIQANAANLAELTRNLARSAEYPPNLPDRVEEQFRTTPLHINLGRFSLLNAGSFSPPQENPYGPYPRIDIDEQVTEDLFYQRHGLPAHDLHTVPPHLLKNFLDYLKDPDRFFLNRRIRRDTLAGITTSSIVGGAIVTKKLFDSNARPDTQPQESENPDPLNDFRQKIGRRPLDNIAYGIMAGGLSAIPEGIAAKIIFHQTGIAAEDSSYKELPYRFDDPKLRSLAVHTFDFERIG